MPVPTGLSDGGVGKQILHNYDRKSHFPQTRNQKADSRLSLRKGTAARDERQGGGELKRRLGTK